MEISYKKDLHHNYLVVPVSEEITDEAYCIKMLLENNISGIIKPEHRIIDGQVQYYFDITSKQSIEIIYAKTTINYEKTKKLFTDLLYIIALAYEYLLNENDLLITPDHIYSSLSTGQVYICYLPGYNKDLNKQITDLIEYIMDKLEYKDKEAVLYTYNLYSVCKEEGFSYDNLLEAVKKDNQESPVKRDARKKIIHEENKPNISEPVLKEQSPIKQIPIMMEKISDDKEQYYYPLKTYIYTGLCLLGAIIMIAISISTKIIYTSLGNRVDYGKLAVLLLILFCIIGYLMKKVWDKNNRSTKIISKEEYVDPRYEENNQREFFAKQNLSINKPTNRPIDKANSYLSKIDKPVYTSDNIAQTVLLNGESYNGGCCLDPEIKDAYEPIQMHDFPFVIGKQKDNVDYYLDKEVVSRYHVKISKEGEKYYITDLNSTNGTCLNKNALSCYQRYEIAEGDQATIAGIKYNFKVYVSAH